jgi:hypothetical protein
VILLQWSEYHGEIFVAIDRFWMRDEQTISRSQLNEKWSKGLALLEHAQRLEEIN